VILILKNREMTAIELTHDGLQDSNRRVAKERSEENPVEGDATHRARIEDD
jgi:hypothetical protein